MPTEEGLPSPLLPTSIHRRVAYSATGLIVVICLTLAVALGRIAEAKVSAISAASLSSLADQLARELSYGLSRLSSEALDEAQNDIYSDTGSTPDAMRQALDRFQRSNPEIAHVSIVDAKTGRVLAATGGILEGANAQGRPVFEAAKQDLFVGDVHDAVRLADLLPRQASGEPARFLDIGAPVRDANGQTIRVFAAHIAFSWAAEVRDHVFREVQSTRGVDASLVDTRGKFVLSGAPDIRVGTDVVPNVVPAAGLAQRVRWPDGAEYLTAQSTMAPTGKFPGLRWRIVARQAYEDAVAPVTSMRGVLLGASVMIAALATALAWVISGRILRPVELLANAAAQADGSLQVNPESISEGLGEVRTVEMALHRLVGTARAHHEASSASERKFEMLAASLPATVWVADAQGTIAYVNRPWFFAAPDEGIADVEDIGRGMGPDDRAAFGRAWRAALAAGQPVSVRCLMTAASAAATPRWHDVAARPLLNPPGNVQGWVGTVDDVDAVVTEAQRAEHALKQAEATAQLRDDFIALASHELRSPLNAILGWSEIIHRRQVDDPQLLKASQVIRRNALRQAALISDMIDMNAALGGRLVLGKSNFDLTEMVQEVLRSQADAALAKGVTLKAADSPPLSVHADRTRLASALSKLVDNAIKFSDSGGQVTLRTARQDHHALISVKDQGKGIAAEFLPHVFDRMRQEDASFSRKAGGIGLGLAMVHAIVKAHGGRIAVSSDGPGRGTAVNIELPEPEQAVAPALQPAQPSREAPPLVRPLQNLSVLLVDDEPDAREVAKAVLSDLGAQVSMASSGAEALSALGAAKFDVLVSDIGMPGMDGMELLKQVRAMHPHATARIPAVALTAFTQESNRQEGMKAGFDAYVAKPISIQLLAESVTVACRRNTPASTRPAV